MSTGEELFDIIVAANVELQNILSLLLNIYADVHALSNPPAPGENNLCSLLSTDFDLLRVVVKNYVSGKLYTSEDKIAVLPNIDSRAFDSSLLLDLLIKFVVTEYKYGNCHNCAPGRCCIICDHGLLVNCNKCRGNGGNPTIKCWHKCKGCKTLAKDCPKTICCTCKTCLACNKKRYDDYVTAILNDEILPPLPCLWYIFTHSLELSKDFRNLFGHVTVEECRKFITDKTARLENFEMCCNLGQLQKYVTFTFSNIVAHAKTKITAPSVTLTEVNKTMSNVACIFKHGEPLKTYLADRCSKIKEIFIDDVRFYDRLDKQVSRFEKMLKENENNIIKFMKEHFPKKHSLQISIKHYKGELDFDLSSQTQYRDSNLKTIDIFHNTLIQVFDENLGLRHLIDYKLKEQNLKIHTANNSQLEFEMKVCQNDEHRFPEQLINLEEFKTRIISSVFSKIKKDTEIYFQDPSEGFIIIKGTISCISGKFTNDQQDHVLDVIKAEGEDFFKTNHIYVNPLVNPSIDLVVNVKAGGDVIDRVKKSEDVIKKCFVQKVNSSPEEEKSQRSDTLLAHIYTHHDVQLLLEEKVIRVVKVKIQKHSPGKNKELIERHQVRLYYNDEEKVTIIKIYHQIEEGCKYDYELIIEDEHQWRWKASVAQLDPFDVNHVELKNPTTNNILIKVAYNQSNIDNEVSNAENTQLGFKASFNAKEDDCIEKVQYQNNSSVSWSKLDSSTRQLNDNRRFLECKFPSSGIYKIRVLVRSRRGIYRFVTLDDIEIFDLEHISSCGKTMLMFHPYGECNDVHRELEVLPSRKAIVKVSIKPSAGGVAKRDIDELDNYIEQNFRNQNVFSFPPLYMTSRETSYYQIVERFETYYQNHRNAKAIILSGADLRENLRTLGYTDEDVDKLCNDTTRTKDVFVFDSNINTVFVINICKGEEANAETLKYHYRQCNNSARLFLTINQHIIGRHPMAIVGIVACLDASRQDVKDMVDCEHCFQQTLTNDDLQSTKSFSEWFHQLNSKVKKNSSAHHLKNSESNEFVFKVIPNRLLLLSAIKSYSLPATSVGTEEEKLSRLVLNFAQIHAVYDDKSRKKVIKGGYGSGKTLILKKTLEILLTDGMPTRVYYILFDPYSMVNMDIFNYASSIPNSFPEKVLIKNVYQLTHDAKAKKVFTLPECLEYIRKLHPNETTHVLVDEYDEEELTQIEALQIKHLMSLENFKDATVVISVQSVEKHSTKLDKNQQPIESTPVLDWETAGMKLYNLQHTMRSTTNISDLVETFQKGVANKKNVIHLPVESTEEPSPVIEKPSKRKRGSLSSKLRKLFSFRKHNVQPNKSPITAFVPTNSSGQSNDPENKSPVDSTSTRDMTSTHSDILQADASIDTLAATSLISSHHSSQIQRSFTFIPSKSGHKIIGTRPKLLRLENHSYIDVSIVQCYIQNYCFKEDHQNKALFICNKINLMQSFIEVFKCLGLEIFEYCDSIFNNQPPSFEKQKNAYDKLMNAEEKNLLVLTDIRGCRGLEYRKVICVVDESNVYERHMLVEGLSRATSHLYIISIRDINESNKTNISEIMDNLVGNDASKKGYVENVTEHCKVKDGIGDIKRENVQIKVDKKQDKSDMMKKKYETMTNRSDLREKDIVRDWSFEDLNVLIKDRTYTKVIQLIGILPWRIQLHGNIGGLGDIDGYGDNNNLLHSASVHDSDVDFVQHLINAGCSLKEKNSYGWMPIHLAALYNRVGIVKVMLNNDPSLINESGTDNLTSLHWAAYDNNKEVVQVLLKHPDIDVNIKDGGGVMADEFADTNYEIKRMIQQHRENNSL